MDIDRIHLSTVISRALRHELWLYEIDIDDDGWADVNALAAVLGQESPPWRNVTHRDGRSDHGLLKATARGGQRSNPCPVQTLCAGKTSQGTGCSADFC